MAEDRKQKQPAWRGSGQQRQGQGRGGNRHQQRSRYGQGGHQQNRRGELPPLEEKTIRPIEVDVRYGDVGQALRVLKNRMSKEGLLQELKRRRHAEKPSEKKRRKQREALRRLRKSKGRARRTGWRRSKPRSKVVASVPIQKDGE